MRAKDQSFMAKGTSRGALIGAMRKLVTRANFAALLTLSG